MSGQLPRMARRVIASLLAIAVMAVAGQPIAASAASQPDEFTKYQRKNRERLDKIFEALHQKGKAIVIIATPAMKLKYPTEAVLDENLADEVTDTGTAAAIDMSMAVEWSNVAEPGQTIVVSQNLHFQQIGPSGYFYRFEGGKTDYLVYVVEPGTYSLHKISYPRPRTKMGLGHGTIAGPGGAALGELRQIASNMLEAEQVSVFLNAATTTVAASEQCNWWYKGVCTQSVYTPEHTKQTRAAGFYPKTEYLPIPALDVSITFKDNVASFQAEAREVLLVDGLAPEPLDAAMAVGTCRTGESMQVCALQAIDLNRAQGSVDQLRGFNFAAELFPRLGKIASAIQYRPLSVKGTSLGEGKFGERYRIAR
jgi:hypothetical protein